MTQTAIQEQIEAIRKVTEEALKTKESALKFLIDAGIIKENLSPTSNLNLSEETKK
jgi:hypothetical protein